MPTVLRMSLPLSLAAAAAVLLLGAAARAEPPVLPDKTIDGATLAVGMICDTAEQAERYAALRAKGMDVNPAATKVNAEVHDQHACGLAAVAYVPDATIATETKGDGLLKIVRVNIVAGYNGSGWQRVANMVQYAVIEAKGISI